MSHLLPVLATLLILLAASDGGTRAVRVAGRSLVGFGRGAAEYLHAVGRWYVRAASGASPPR